MTSELSRPPRSPELGDFETDHHPSNGRWETLAAAFAAHGYPTANLPLVQRLTDGIGIDHFEGIPSRSYIKAIRRGAGRTLSIAFGYTGGLEAEAEIVDAVGDVPRGSSADGREWWMHHVVNKIRDGDGSLGASHRRDHGRCDNCFVALPASGVCDECAA